MRRRMAIRSAFVRRGSIRCERRFMATECVVERTFCSNGLRQRSLPARLEEREIPMDDVW